MNTRPKGYASGRFLRESGQSGARQGCATHMLENGADIRFIPQLLGHSKLETTSIYTQVSIEKLRQVHASTHPSLAKLAVEKSLI